MSYSDRRERASPARFSTVSQTSSSSYYAKPTREQGGRKDGNRSWRGRSNWRSQPGDYRGHSSFITQSYVPCKDCGDGAHPRWKCLFYDRMCPRCFKLGHSPDYCSSTERVAGVSFYHNACYFSAETILKLASFDFDTRREEIKFMYNVLTPDEVSVISLAMEMFESNASRRARCFRCRDFHSPRLCWYSGRQCGLCGRQGHAEVACSLMSLSRNTCEYHDFDPYSSNQSQNYLLPQGEAFPYDSQSNFYNCETANVMEPQYPSTRVADTIDITGAAESKGVSPDPGDTSWAGPDPVYTSWADPVDTSWAGPDPVDTYLAGLDPVNPKSAGSDPVDPSSAGPDPVDESNCKIPDPVDSSCDVSDPVDSSSDAPDLVDPSCDGPDPVNSGCEAPNPGYESCVFAPADPSFAGPDPVDESNCKITDPVDSSCDVSDSVNSSSDFPDLVDPSYAGPDPVDSGCAAPNAGYESCAVAAPADPSFSPEGSTSSNCTVGDPTYFNEEAISASNPNEVVEKPKHLIESSVGPVNSNLVESNISTSEPSTSTDFSTSEPVCSESVNRQDDTQLNPSTADLKSSCLGEIVKCTLDSTTTLSSLLVSFSVPEKHHLAPCAAVSGDREKESRAKGSTTSTSSGSSSDDTYFTAKEDFLSSEHSDTEIIPSSVVYLTADEGIHSSKHSDTEMIPSRVLTSVTEAGSERNNSDGQKRLDVPPQITRDWRLTATTVLPPCSRCLSRIHLPENCYAQGSTCFICKCKGHLARACLEPKPLSSRTPIENSPSKKSRARVIDRVRKKEAACRSSSDNDSALPPSPVATSSMSPPEKIHSDTALSDGSTASKFPPTTALPPCCRCLSTKHLPENCWAQEITCFICHCKGHIARACSELKPPSSRTPIENSPSKKSRARVIHRVRKKEAACRSRSESDSALPPSPILPAPTRDLASSEMIRSDKSPSDGSTDLNSQNRWNSAEDASQLATITPTCSGSNGFKTQEADQDEEKVAAIGPTNQRRMMAGDATGDPRHKQPQHKQRRDDQHRHDRPPHQQYSSRGAPSKQNRKHIDIVAAASAAVVAAAGSSVRQEPRGTPLALLNRMSAAHPGVPGVTPSRQHEVLVQLPVPHGRPPLPYPTPSATEDIWDQFHVRMPCSSSSLYARDSLPPGYPDTRSRDTVPRWNVIKWALTQPLKSADDVQRAIVSYNSRYHDKWLLHGLKAVVLQFSEEEEDQFFGRTLPNMCQLALRLPDLVTRAPSLLVAHRCKAVTLSQLQIASLLANAFFCTFPRRNAKGSDTEYALFPDINFSRLLNADGPTVLEKIKCLLNYFRVVTTTEPVGLVTFARHMVENAPAVVWQQCSSALPRLHCDDGGLIEEATGLLQVDFANRFLGGGVLGHGCVQEEIRFMLCPELLITRLLAEALDKNEAIIVVGVEQYSRGEGYADSFVFAGRHEDTAPRDSFGRRMCQLTAIDAVHFRARPSVQFKEELVVREINKAYAGFCALDGTVGDLPAVATGNWGCGAFRGNPHLKALLQLAACGYAGRDVAYFTFLDAKLKNRIADMHEFLVKGGVTVGALVQCICQYGALSREVDGSDLYQYLYHNLRDPSRTPSPGDSPRPTDQGPQQTGNASERTSGSSWAAKSREMNGNGFDGANGKNGAQYKARGKDTLANNARITDFYPRLPERGPWRNNKNGTDILTETGNGSIASVHQPSSCSPCLPSQSSGGFWDDSSPGQGTPAKGSGGRGGGRHKRNRGRAKEGLTDQQIVDAITEPDTIQEENGDVRGEANGSGPGEEFNSSAAKRGRKKKNKVNRRNAHNVKDGNVLNNPVNVNKVAIGLDRKMSTGHDDHRLTIKKNIGFS